MSTTARLLTTALVTVALSGVAMPLASAAFAAPGPNGNGIGWDVTSAAGTVPAAHTSGTGIGWD